MKTAVHKYLLLIPLLILAVGFNACSSGDTIKAESPKGEKSLSFYDYDNGKGTHYQVYFDKKNNITSLYIDGKEIPAEDYRKHRNIIDENLDDLSTIGSKERKPEHIYSYDFSPDIYLDSLKIRKPLLPEKFHIYKWDDSSFTENMSKLRKELKENRKHFYLQLDDSSFKEDMKRMKEEVAKLKDIKIKMHFDKDKMKIEMDKMRRELENMNLNEDLKEINESIRRMTEELKDTKIDIKDIDVDIPDIHIEIENLNKKMSGLDKELSGLKTELKKIDAFMDEVRAELLKDGVIKDKDEDFSMSLKKDKMEVNDKELPADLLKKYKELYRKHFGKEISDHQRFEIN